MVEKPAKRNRTFSQGKNMILRQVQIQGVDMFGRGVGFLKFTADVFEKETGTKIPGIVFAWGPAVAVLILLESGGETYIIRVAVGKSILELPAGMLDDESGDVIGTAVREGGCDEELSLFLYRDSVKDEVIRALHGKEMGLRDHGERIKVHIIPYHKLWRVTADVKALSAIALYKIAKREGLLPQSNSQLSK